MKTRWLVGGLVSLLVGGSVVSAQGLALTRGPYLQSTTRDSVIVVWQTNGAGSSVVEYGESGYTHAMTDAAPVSTHVVAVTGLTAGTSYRYRILTDGVALHEATFATAPDPGRAFSFVMIGDSGHGEPEQYAVAAQMLALHPDFMLHLGDVVYPNGQTGGYDPYFFAPYHDLIDRVPVFPTLGNHDYHTANGQPYLDAFYLPATGPGGERYYSFDWGDAHFVALDSNRGYGPGSLMLQWLASDLAASTAKWKFVFFHHALFTAGPHRNDSTLPALKQALEPLFAQYGVDVVFNGHDHDYERSEPQNGVIYIVSGGGGYDLYDMLWPDRSTSYIAYAAQMYHTVQVQIHGCILSLRAIDTRGAVFDQIALAKGCSHQWYLPIILKR